MKEEYLLDKHVRIVLSFLKTPRYQIVLFLGILILSWFYWFQWRPSSIRQGCYSTVLEIRDKRADTKDKLTNSEANNYYRRCFVENGLKPEDLLK